MKKDVGKPRWGLPKKGDLVCVSNEDLIESLTRKANKSDNYERFMDASNISSDSCQDAAAFEGW